MTYKIMVVITLLTLGLSFPAPLVQAQGDLPSGIVGGIEETGKRSGLPSYAPGAPYNQGKPHPKSSYYYGATEITSAFLYTIDFLKYIVAPLAIFYLIIIAIRIITAGHKVDEIITSQKEAIQWVILGLLVIFLANTLVYEVFFGAEGDVFEDTDLTQDYAITGARHIAGVYNLIKIFLPVMAVLVIVISGLRLIVQAYDEEATKAAKKHIFWAIGGLIAIGLAELIVQIFFPYFSEERGGFFIDTDKLKEQIAVMTNFAAGFITTIAVAAITYAGYLYTAFFGQDDMIEKSKKIFKGAVYALLVALAAFAATATFMTLPQP